MFPVPSLQWKAFTEKLPLEVVSKGGIFGMTTSHLIDQVWAAQWHNEGTIFNNIYPVIVPFVCVFDVSD